MPLEERFIEGEAIHTGKACGCGARKAAGRIKAARQFEAQFRRGHRCNRRVVWERNAHVATVFERPVDFHPNFTTGYWRSIRAQPAAAAMAEAQLRRQARTQVQLGHEEK